MITNTGEGKAICPICGDKNNDNWPLSVNAEIKLGGCQGCWEKQCAESWHEMAENIGWMKLIKERDYWKRRCEAAEEFIEARLACCAKSHICDAGEFQKDFETFTAWQSIKGDPPEGENKQEDNHG